MSKIKGVECDRCGYARFIVPPHVNTRAAAANAGWTTATEPLPNGKSFTLDTCPVCTKLYRTKEKTA